MVVLYLVVFIGLTGVGIIVPLFPFFGEHVGASPAEITLLMAVFAAGQFVAAPIWGWWSDRVGRKPVFVITLVGSAAAYILLGLADTVPTLLFARLVAGLMAGNIPVAFAAASDLSSGKDRSMIMGRVGAAFSLGFIFGPAIGGLLAGPTPQSSDFMLIAFSSAGLCMVAVVVTLVSFKETHKPDRRRILPMSMKLISVRGMSRFFTMPVLGALIGVNFIFVAGGSMLDSTFALYANKEHQFGPNDIGFLFTYMGLIMAVVQGTAIGPLTRRFGDAKVLRTGLMIFILGLVLLIIADGLPMILGAMTCLTIGNALFVPSSSSLASQSAPAADQGAALGAFQAAGNLGRVVTPTFSGVIFAEYGTTAPFMIAIIFILPAFFLLHRAMRQANVVKQETSAA